MVQVRVVLHRYAEMASTRRVGGQSEVIQASDLHDGGRQVAVKLIPADDDPIHRVFFERETVALDKLDHPNIAKLRDRGLDPDLQQYFLVLDWVPQTMSDWRRDFDDPPGWDDVADVLALPLSSALAHSHSNAVLHRDIKPSNVLWDDGRPLLADFALSKIKDQVARPSEATVVDLVSAPWAPPDQRSKGSTRFDVYGLAATILQALVDFDLVDYPDIARALDSADMPPPVEHLLRRALDPDPDMRPEDARVFDAELRAIQHQRQLNWHENTTLHFELTHTARSSLEAGAVEQTVDDLLAERLGATTYIIPRLRPVGGRPSLVADEFRLVGDNIEMTLVFTSRQGLKCTNAWLRDHDELERWRRDPDATMLDVRDYTWTLKSPLSFRASVEAAGVIKRMLEQAIQDSTDRASARFKEARLNSWSQLIEAKERLEEKLEEPIDYVTTGQSGMEFTLHTPKPVNASLLDQDRLARAKERQGPRPVPVSIVDIDDEDLIVRASNPESTVPPDGVLVRDRVPSQSAVRRQKEALGSLREGAAARAHLREIVLDPTCAQIPQPVSFSPVTPELDDDKRVAVAMALGTPDVFLVEGPPGTGKTSFICELVHQHLRARPQDKILVVSQMHVAIDNAVTRLHRSGIDSVVRLSNRDGNVDPDAAHLLLANKLADWVERIRLQAEHGIEELANREGVLVPNLRLVLRIEEAIAAMRQRDDRATQLGPLTDDDRLENEELDEQRVEQLADLLRAEERLDERLSSMTNLAESLNIFLSSPPTAEGLQRAVDGLLRGSEAKTRFRSLLRTQADWLASLHDSASSEPMFLPTQSVIAGTCMGFLSNKNIQNMQFDLCIIDEASRATAPELLVPMVKSQRWVMVGDSQQLPPMQEEVFEHPDIVESFDLDRVFLSASLFDTLLHEVPRECRTRLVTQHRMSVPIGNLISQTFYGGDLTNEPIPVVDPNTFRADDRVVWFTTSQLPNRHEEKRAGDTSTSNPCEADIIAKRVAALSTDVGAGLYKRFDEATLKVLILTGYVRQKVAIERALRRIGFKNLDVQVKTIDAVQGREADIVMFSVTRSNLQGDLGFLANKFEGRVNVALSRAQEALWIVGDSDFCGRKEGPLKRVVEHIERDPDCRLERL